MLFLLTPHRAYPILYNNRPRHLFCYEVEGFRSLESEAVHQGQAGPLRVLHIGKYYPPYNGGMENFLRDLLCSLHEEGICASALVHDHIKGRRPLFEEREGIEILRSPLLGEVLYIPFSPQFPLCLRDRIRSFRPHILHFHFPNPSAFWSFLLPEARSIPWVVQWQSDVVPSKIDRRLQAAYIFYRPFEQSFLKRAKQIIVSSRPYLEFSRPLEKWFSKCSVIPLGVDPGRLPWPKPDEIDAAERTWGAGKLRVLAAGRLTYYKGFEILIRASQRLPGMSLQIVGDGGLKGQLQKEITRGNLEGRVRLRGSLQGSELRALFATCDCLCLSSIERTEAFGVVLLEAMKYGRALVASDIPGSGVGWVVRESRSGVLIPPADEKALAEVLDRLCENPSLCKSLGEKGKVGFQRSFHIKSVAARVARLYQAMLRSI